MNRTTVPILVVCLAATMTATGPPQNRPAAPPPDDPVITIDGAKNPEKIPEWAAWQEAIRFMAQPAEPEIPIPTGIWVATSPEERAWIRRESLNLLARDRELLAAVIKLGEGVNSDNFSARSEKVDAIEMDRRRAALETRDRLLSLLPGEAQVALRAFIEHTRKGFKVQIQKSKIAQFMLPE